MQHLQGTLRWARKRSSGSRAISSHVALEDTGVCDSASLEMLISSPWESFLILEWKFFSHLLRETSYWQTGTDNGNSQLMKSPLLHWSISGTNVSFRTDLYCLLVTAFHKAPPGWRTRPCWLVMKFGNYLCVDLMLPNFTALRLIRDFQQR